MDVKTFRAHSMQEAVALVARDLGPDATVLHTREVRSPLRWLLGGRRLEVTASTTVAVPSRLAPLEESAGDTYESAAVPQNPSEQITSSLQPPASHIEHRTSSIQHSSSSIQHLASSPDHTLSFDLPEAYFHLFSDLGHAEVSEDLIRGPNSRRGPGELANRENLREIRHSAPPLIVVAGAQRGAGATSVSITLAAALARQGQRVVLIDADSASANLASLCGITARDTIADVLAGRRVIHEVLQSAAGGVQIVGGARPSLDARDVSFSEQRRLLGELRRLGTYADAIVLDVGSTRNEQGLNYWQAADRVLLVTTPHAAAVMDAYAAIKMAKMNEVTVDAEIFVNQTENEEQGASVHQRIEQSCVRFLGTHVALAGDLPLDPRLKLAARQQQMLALTPETSVTVQAMEAYASQLFAVQELATEGG